MKLFSEYERPNSSMVTSHWSYWSSYTRDELGLMSFVCPRELHPCYFPLCGWASARHSSAVCPHLPAHFRCSTAPRPHTALLIDAWVDICGCLFPPIPDSSPRYRDVMYSIWDIMSVQNLIYFNRCFDWHCPVQGRTCKQAHIGMLESHQLLPHLMPKLLLAWRSMAFYDEHQHLWVAVLKGERSG